LPQQGGMTASRRNNYQLFIWAAQSRYFPARESEA
jgi:hypothetical protein